MPYKISGTINTAATVYAVEMNSGTFLGSVDAIPPIYEIDASPFINGVSGTVSVVAVTPDGESLSFSNIEPIEFAGDRGVFAGGGTAAGGVNNQVIEYITISTIGNATDFGGATIRPGMQTGTSNGSYDRGIIGNCSSPYITMCYITISRPGVDALFFGNLYNNQGSKTAVSNKKNDRAAIAGGQSGVFFNCIDYMNISTLGDATDAGDLTTARRSMAGMSNAAGNRGVFAGGPTYVNDIDYITITSTANAANFGDLTEQKDGVAGTDNGVNNRGIMGGGRTGASSWTNVIEYLTITSTSNSTNFGDLVQARTTCAANSNGVNNRAVFGGGATYSPTVYYDIMEYITITSTSDTTDFGDLSEGRGNPASCSNA